MSDSFRNRIVGQAEVDPGTLVENPQNWRVHPAHQTQAVAAALDKIGWIQRVIVNKTTGHLVDGHLRLSIALERKEPSIPVDYVELSEQEEKLALATFDPLAALAVADVDLLAELRRESEADGTLGDVLDDLIGAEAKGLESAQAPGPEDNGQVANDKDFWPVIRVQVPPDTFAKYQRLLQLIESEDQGEAFGVILDHALAHAEEAGGGAGD